MSLDINDINTVTDLLNAQQTPEETHTSNVVDHIIEQILEEDPSAGLEIVNRVLYALREFHGAGVEEMIKKGKSDYAAKWAEDHTKIDMAINLVKDIQLWVFRNK